MKEKIVLIFLVFFSSFTILKSQELLINEILSSNRSILADEDGDYEDWIEIYNPTGAAVNLNGYGISDNTDDPYRWIFPEVILPVGNYLIIWASGKNRRDPAESLHTNFSIAMDGETIILSDNSGNLIDQSLPVTLKPNVSYGRKPNGGENWYFFDVPTPGSSNSGHGYEGITESPVFSHQSGFYTNPFELNISTTSSESSIRYTLDGSTPLGYEIPYTGPITIKSRTGDANDISMIRTNNDYETGPPYYDGWQPPAGEIFKTTVVRAVAVRDNYIPSATITHTYLVDGKGADRYTLPVIFLNTDRDYLFGHEYGIYIPGQWNNMYQRGRNWEMPVHFELIENDGTKGFSMDMGIRTHGGTTRSRPRKSLRLYARSEYGNSVLNYQLFPEKNIYQFKRILLRNSGNDWGHSVFRDGFMQFLARDLNVETMYYRPSIVFINGEYWGIHNIRDRYDEHYIRYHYGLSDQDITIAENDAKFAYGNPDGLEHYNQMFSFIENNNMSLDVNFDHVNTMMDFESFADANITNIFIMNTDWPGNNLNYFRRITDYDNQAPKGLDGRWRWMMLDTDFGFGLNYYYVPGSDEGAAHNTLAMATEAGSTEWPNYDWSTLMFRKLLENQKFRYYFINRFADLLNTTFKEDRVISIIDSIQSILAPEMEEHIHRWGRPADIVEWNQIVNEMRSFAKQRPDFMRQHILTQFNISGTYNIDLQINDTSMGKIRINTINPDLSEDWRGIYFNGIPITLEAKEETGYRFSHWSGSQNSELKTWEINPNGNSSYTAHFEIDPDFQEDDLNPVAFILQNSSYKFDYWSELNPDGAYPPNMLFLQTSITDPGISDEMTKRYSLTSEDYHEDDLIHLGFPYRLTRRSRINGLGNDGISFINTGQDRDLGSAVLALDTRSVTDINVSWSAGTLIPNSRTYAIRLQYKIGTDGVFKDVVDDNGNLVEYMRSEISGHTMDIGPVKLPTEANDQEYMQLRWKYYYTGEQLTSEHGRRDMLRLDNIHVYHLPVNVEINPGRVDKIQLMQNYPNPFSEETTIPFNISKGGNAQLQVIDMLGRIRYTSTEQLFPSGLNKHSLNLSYLEPGIYFYRIISENEIETRMMILAR